MSRYQNFHNYCIFENARVLLQKAFLLGILSLVIAFLKWFQGQNERYINILKVCVKAWGLKQNHNSEVSMFNDPVSDVSADNETSLAQLTLTAHDALDTDDLLTIF